MTNPTPFEYTDDTVTARFNVDIPANAHEDVNRLAGSFGLLRAQLEAVERVQGSVIGYLREMPQVQERATQAQREYVSQLERGSILQQEIRGTTGGARNQAPHGYVDPWAGITAGRGGGVRGTAASPEEVRRTLAGLDPRMIANMEAQRGRSATISEIEDLLNRREGRGSGPSSRRRRQGSDEDDTGEGGSTPNWQDESLPREERLSGLRSDVLNELQTPGHFGRGALLAGRGLASIFGGGRAASLLRGVGVAGLVAGGALAVNNRVQDLGQRYQELKNEGLVQGGGAMEGISQNVQAYTMALSPFITVEQSRKIIQTALSQGYHGKQFDTITEMVAYNTKEMAMDIGQSFATIKKQMIEGGQTAEGYKAQQEMTKQLAASSTIKSLPELQQEIASYQGSLIDMGTPAGLAGQLAAEDATVFPENADMKDIVANIGKAMGGEYGNNTLMVGIMSYARSKGVQFPPGTAPYDIPTILGDKFQEYKWGYLKMMAQRYRTNPRGFYGWTQTAGLGLSPNQAKKLQAHLLGDGDIAMQGKKGVERATNKVEDKGFNGGWTKTLFGDLGGGHALETIGGILSPIINAKSVDDFKNIPKKISENVENAQAKDGRYSNPVINNLMSTFGASQIEVLDENGNPQRLDTDNREQMERLGSGEYKWRKKGDQGSGLSLSESMNITDDSYKQTMSEVRGNLQVELSPEAKRFLQVPNQVQLTPNQHQANEGWGSATDNNPPPGDAPVRPGWGGHR